MVFAKAGLDNGLLYYIPKVGSKFISFSFLISTILSIIIILVGLLFIENDFTLIMLPLIMLLTLEQLFFSIYRSNEQIKEYYIVNGIISFIIRITIVTILIPIIGNEIWNVAIAVYLSFLFSISYYFFQCRDSFTKINYSRTYLKYSLPLVLSASMAIMIDKIDIIMIGNMLDNTSVGIYQISAQIANVTSMLLIIFNTVFAPKISKLYHQNKIDDLRAVYIKSTKVLGLISLTFLIGVFFFGDFILHIFGEEVMVGRQSLLLRSIGQFVNVAVGSVWLMLAMTGKPKFQMYANFIAFIINVVLNFILIPKFGIDGAAFASMVTIVFMNIIGYTIVSKTFNIKAYKFF